MKNFFIKRAFSLASKFIPQHRNTHRVLIVSTTALGDSLWGAPAIENIRRSFPSSYIALLTSPIGMEVFKFNPHIDKLYPLKDPLLPRLLSLWKTLYKEKFDTILLFHASQRLTLPLCSLLGASRIIGTSGINKGLDSLLTHPLPNHTQHEITRRLKISESFGAKTETEKLSFYIDPEEILPPRTNGPWIAIHPGAKDPFKRWPKENFIEVGKRLKNDLNCEILITGTSAEQKLIDEIAKAIPGAHPYDTKTSLRGFAAQLNQMDLLISNDTGPVHLACALNKPVIAIYASTDPNLCGPHHAQRATTISRRATCDPCLKRKCRRPFCLAQIGPEEVVTAAKRKLLN